jgi:hypothetical protein
MVHEHVICCGSASLSHKLTHHISWNLVMILQDVSLNERLVSTRQITVSSHNARNIMHSAPGQQRKASLPRINTQAGEGVQQQHGQQGQQQGSSSTGEPAEYTPVAAS